MSRILLVVFWVLSVGSVFAEINNDSLRKVLDQTLQNRDVFMQEKENRVHEIKLRLQKSQTLQDQYELVLQIIEEYRVYDCDSALAYIDKNRILSECFGREEWLIRNKLQYSFVLSSSGLFVEAMDVLRSIPVRELSDELKILYYKDMEQLYLNLKDYTSDRVFSNRYFARACQYADTVLALLPESSAEHLLYKYHVEFRKGNDEVATPFLEKYLQQTKPYTHSQAAAYYDMAILKGKDENEKEKYLMLAAIADTKACVKENLSLLGVATVLYDKGDISGAYRYLQYALEDANFYNARFRNLQISKVLPIIEQAYQQQNIQQRERLRKLLILISVLAIGLVVTIIYIRKQMTSLTIARKKLSGINDNLNTVNRELAESNHIKEEYVGYFLDLCLQYIDRLENFKKMVSRKIKSGQSEELLKQLSPSRNGTTDAAELYTNFDTAFLHIYPNFVSEFNSLLKEEERYVLKEKDKLNTELRIFALIRLGITDSNKIASFLRYSLQTIYNYRSKVRGKALHEEDDFETKIRNIGTVTLQNTYQTAQTT